MSRWEQDCCCNLLSMEETKIRLLGRTARCHVQWKPAFDQKYLWRELEEAIEFGVGFLKQSKANLPTYSHPPIQFQRFVVPSPLYPMLKVKYAVSELLVSPSRVTKNKAYFQTTDTLDFAYKKFLQTLWKAYGANSLYMKRTKFALFILINVTTLQAMKLHLFHLKTFGPISLP